MFVWSTPALNYLDPDYCHDHCDLELSKQQVVLVNAIAFLGCIFIVPLSWENYLLFGLAPLAWVLNSELFPKEVKTPASGAIFNWNFAFSTPSQKMLSQNTSITSFRWSQHHRGSPVLIYFVVPETKGRTEEEMRENFLKKIFRTVNLQSRLRRTSLTRNNLDLGQLCSIMISNIRMNQTFFLCICGID